MTQRVYSFNQFMEVTRLFKNITFHPIMDLGGSRGVIEDTTPFLEKERGFLFWGKVES